MVGEDAQRAGVRFAVEVSRQQDARVGGERVADVAQLFVLVDFAQAEVGVGDDDAVFFHGDDAATADLSGQGAVKDEVDRGFGEDEVAVQGEMREAAVGLHDGVGKAGLGEELFGLAAKAVAQAAQFDFLQADDVVGVNECGDARQGAAFAGVGQDLPVPLPAVA